MTTRRTNISSSIFSEMFRAGMHKSAMIGVFLAVLELVRHHRVLAEQNEPHGEIWIRPGENLGDAPLSSDPSIQPTSAG